MPKQDSACFRLAPLVSRQLNRETDATSFMPVKQMPASALLPDTEAMPCNRLLGALAAHVNNP
jgi:hypothetical protein